MLRVTLPILAVMINTFVIQFVVDFANGTEGRWEGAIHIGPQELGIAVELRNDAGEWSGTIDIPAQGAVDLALENVTVTPPNIRFELPAGPGLAVFEGTVEGDSIAGTFTQAGFTGAFFLLRQETRTATEIPIDPPPYDETEVTFYNPPVTLAGTLTQPPGPGPYPAVVLVTGSGAQNRDEELFGFKPFHILADYFTRNGIAVLRYDDRGVGGSSGDVSTSTSADFAQDALSAIALLKTFPTIAPNRIGIVGHSEGGLVAPLAANQSADVAFIVLLAGPAVPGDAILAAQTELILRASGVPDSVAIRQLRVQRQLIEAARNDVGWEVVRDTLRAIVQQQMEGMDSINAPHGQDRESFIMRQVDAQLHSYRSPWFRFFLDHDPVPILESLTIPVLALFGELDLQVPPELNSPIMERSLRASQSPAFSVQVLPRLNHLFLPAVTGSPTEYATMPKEFQPEFLDLLTRWILGTGAGGQQKTPR